MSENAAQIKVTPMSVRVKLRANETEEGVLTVTNATDNALEYKIYASPYYVDENYSPVFSVENAYTKLSKWITFGGEEDIFGEEYTVRIEGGGSREIKYRVAMPEGADDNSQYAIIFIESSDPDQETVSGVILNSRVGVTVYGETDKNVVKISEGQAVGEIGEAHMDSFMLGGNLEVSAPVTNSGNISMNATEHLVVKNIFGVELYNVNNTVEVMPETTRDVAIEWEATPIMGFLNVEYTITAGEAEISGSQFVTKLPVAVIALVLAALIVAAISLTRILKNRKSATGHLLPVRHRR